MQIDNILEKIAGYTTGFELAMFAIFVGIFLMIKTKFYAFKAIFNIHKLLKKNKVDERDGISPLQSLALSVGAHVGVGNIVGVAIAISYGGPGAIFWMWVTAIIGSSLMLVESVLAQIYKQKRGTHLHGGPAFYMSKGLGLKKTSKLLATFIMLGTGCFWIGFQANSMNSAIRNVVSINTFVIAVIVAVVVAFLVIKGTTFMGKFSEKVVPKMAIGYIGVSLFVILVHYNQIIPTLSLILRSAFDMEAIFSGVATQAIIWGIKRGLYSNEAGMGTTGHFAASVKNEDPFSQGVVQIVGLVIDTLLICSLTALMILVTNSYNVYHFEFGELVPIVEYAPFADSFIDYTSLAIGKTIPIFSNLIVMIFLVVFALTSIVSFFYIAQINFSFITDETTLSENKVKLIKRGLFILAIISIVITSLINERTMILLTDIGLGINGWINLSLLVLLHHKVVELLPKKNKKPNNLNC